MGGEHSLAVRVSTAALGSPPHGRGAPGDPRHPPGLPRLTPAWAGSTAGCGRCPRATQAHPRMGGEHQPSPLTRRGTSGSPPHGRGARRWSGWGGRGFGLTPAWAGSTADWTADWPVAWAHPRMGGEHNELMSESNSTEGSPPHGRGAQRQRRAGLESDRLTPAWAGSTEPSRVNCNTRRAHPRMGGEHPRVVAWVARVGGSPPHGRGARYDGPPVGGEDGLTPAWAGSTTWANEMRASFGAHPRMGGEHQAVRD